MQLFKKFFLQQADLAEADTTALELLVERLPRGPLDEVRARLEARTATPTTLTVEKDWAADDTLLCTLSFGAHSVDVAGIPAPLPSEVLERTVMVSHWGGAFRARAAGHAAHLILLYSGASREGIAQATAVYQVAAALFAPDQLGTLLAAVNEPAWTAHPGHFVPQLVAAEMLPVLAESPPLPFWTGLLKLDADGESIFLTRGYHRFGLPDLALQGYGHDQAREAHELLHDLFHYLHYENRDVRPGDFLTIADVGYLAFADGADYRRLFGGVADILVVRPSSHDELEHVASTEPSPDAP